MNLRIPSHIPFSPKKLPVFYGWPVLFFGTLGLIMSIPGQTIGISVFTEQVRGVIAVSLPQWTFAYMAGTFISGLIVPQAGKWYDKVGARIMSTFTSVMLGASLVYLSFIDHITFFFTNGMSEKWQGLIATGLLTVGFWGIRFFGQGMLTMASRNMVMKWFDRFRGRVTIFLGLGTIIFFNSSPYLLKQLVDEQGWVLSWRILALILVAFACLAFVFFRDSPEVCDMKPDGNLATKGKKQKDYIIEKEYSLKEARKTYAFWIFNLIFALNAFYITGLTIQIENIFNLAGLDDDIAYSIFVPSSFVAVVFSIAGGYISDKIKLKYLACFYAFCMVISLLGIYLLSYGAGFKWLIIFGMGVAGSMYFLLTSVAWPRFYGVKHLGAISGYSLGWIVIGSAIGPFFMAYLKELSGSYNLSTIIVLCIGVSLGLLALKVENRNEQLFLQVPNSENQGPKQIRNAKH